MPIITPTCSCCESMFTLDYETSATDGEAYYCPFCGTEILDDYKESLEHDDDLKIEDDTE